MEIAVSQTLDMLAQTFTVRHIMIPRNELTCACSMEKAASIFSDPHCRYDVIPIESEGVITGFVRRGVERRERIAPPILVSDGTGLLDLLDVLCHDRPFCFVLSKDSVCGFVHFSDFNHPLVKLPLFVLIERVEVAIWSVIEPLLDDALLRKTFNGETYLNIQKRIERARKGV